MTLQIKTREKISVQDTLLENVPVNGELVIKTKLIKANSIRSAVRSLKKKGYAFSATEDGYVDEVLVTRGNK